MTTGFVLREGLAGLRRNLTMTVALIITTAISLALLGVGVLVGQMTRDTKAMYLDQVEVLVQFDAAISAADAACTSPECAAVRDRLSSNEGVAEVTFSNQQQTFERFRELFAESDPVLVEQTSPGALPAELHVRLTDPTDASPLDGVAEMPGVLRIIDQSDDVRAATGHLDAIRNAAFALAVLQALAAVFLVSNMVALSAYHRREEVAIMRVVGATRAMTHAPFVVEAVLASVVGAILATVGVVLGNRLVAAPALSGLYDARIIARVTEADVLMVMPLVGVVGVVVAGLAAAGALRAYVRS
ncbi:permease-like cell division protein FtsX [Corynebacterium uterequi]|uniref:Cell division protein FtsX n=1 Tax=Corynebacterium uterequi TaxID=1072256 RepID=A0A0G3HF63_9CORY|nr:permease-like cell division protein FtsX [Corynebacterium uterequi]AKK10598.1 cell division protein [Corynebacterium uterequi]